jgi:hypothetical protein
MKTCFKLSCIKAAKYCKYNMMLQPLLLSVMRGVLHFIKVQLDTLVLHVAAVPGWGCWQ